MGNYVDSNKGLDNSKDFIRYLDLIFLHWKFILCFLLISLFLAAIYFRYSEKVYYSQAIILLQDEKQASGEMAGLSELASLAGRTASSAAYVNDQTQILMSRRLIGKVVDSEELTVGYFKVGKIRDKEMVKSHSPIQLKLLDSNDPRLDTVIFELFVSKKGDNLQVWDNHSAKRRYTIGQVLNSSIGRIQLVSNSYFDIWEGLIRIQVIPRDFAINILRGMLEVNSNSKEQSFAIKISSMTSSPEKGELLINSLINQYDQDRTFDKESISRNTSNFINSRLSLISKDLKEADSKVATFKGKNDLADIKLQTQQSMQNLSEQEVQLLNFQTQIYLLELVRDQAISEEKALLPSNIGLEDESIQSIIQSYNTKILDYYDLMRSSTSENPVVRKAEIEINSIKKSLNSSLDNYKRSLEVNLEKVEIQLRKTKGEIKQFPLRELNFKDVSRQQKVIESIYLFLLQKREENEINASSKPANIKVVDYAYGYGQPVSPKKLYVFGVALLIGFFVPFGIIYIKNLLDNKIHTKDELEELVGAPFLGQVPKYKGESFEEDSRSSLAESLRIIRTNLAFMLSHVREGGKVIYVTSSISGEGKSFIATNLAKVISYSGKRVLLIGADIRSPKILEYLGISQYKHTNIGITDYLINPSLPIESLLIHKPKPYVFDLIYSGSRAPNPAELLMNGNFERIIEFGRSNYDYIIVDTAPVSLVTDTLLIAEYADMTVYVSRANYLQKQLTTNIREIYVQGKLRNMALILNDVDFNSRYGYGYGYGYGNEERKRSGIWSIFLHKAKRKKDDW